MSHIYVHIPFCERKCPYCDFFSQTDFSLREEYAKAASEEILRASKTDTESDTVYFGGGTPSAIDSRNITLISDTIFEKFDLKNTEVTIEVNPNSLTESKAKDYISAGFNRISIGVQSLNDDTLKTLGRLHDRKAALNAIDTARKAGFENISADLIIAVPGQAPDQPIKDCEELINAGVKHISTYSLSIEPGTKFFKLYDKTIEDLVPPETERKMYWDVRDFLESRGIIPYEISNSAIKGYESRHNLSYWNQCNYLGIGAGAHGYMCGRRYCHPKDINAYIQNPTQTELLEEMDSNDEMHEYPFLKLRTCEGISKSEFNQKFGVSIDEVFKSAIEKNVQSGMLENTEDAIRLTRKGFDFANSVFMDFL